MSAPQTNQPVSALTKPVGTLWGVGRERAAQLARLGILIIEDLLLHRPQRYEDRRHFCTIAELRTDESATTRGTVVALGLKRFRHGQKSVFELILDDGTGRLHCRWWNLPFMEKYFAVGDEVFVFGKLVETKPRTIDHPETEVVESGEEDFIHLNRIAPVYPLTEGLPQRWLRALIWRTLNRFESEITEPWPEIRPAEQAKFGVPALADTEHERPVKLTPLRIQPLGGGTPNVSFPTRANAVHMLHFPENLGDVDIARRRLALDEFIALQRDMQLRRKRFETQTTALPCSGTNRSIKPFLAQLGFRLTAAQTRVLREIRHDMAGRHPMRRLLQGDVGSGKTVVAACTALMAIESGFNVALMAPTEILAEQHFRNFKRWFETLGINVELQTGSRKTASDKWRMTSDGERLPGLPVTRHPSPATLFIGTHALIEPGFAMEKLGLVIIDEQHKFGVAQREQLVRKGRYPHVLVMTATPIPRTLGLTLYGDLDVSVIDEPPSGRGRIRTFVRTADTLPQVWEFIRGKLAEGQQAYVVYPRVEDSGNGDVKAVTREYENLKKALSPFRVGLLHGELGSRRKEEVMHDFRNQKVCVLLATSLVEVGLDAPNATIMLVENAEQFGLAQLHQLRGRVGRGAHDSYCILVASAKTAEARQRLEVLEQTTDGFQIAEADLKLRGPGELMGQQQSGLPRLRFGDLREDFELIKQARDLAVRMLADA